MILGIESKRIDVPYTVCSKMTPADATQNICKYTITEK